MVPHLRGFRRICLLVLIGFLVTLLPPGTPGGSSSTTTAVAATTAVSPIPPAVVPPVDFRPSAFAPDGTVAPMPEARMLSALSPEEGLISEGKPATASSEAVPWDGSTWVAGNANDGDLTTSWASDWYQGLPQWWQVDLGQVYPITRVRAQWDTSVSSVAYTIAVSDDGITFVDVVTHPTEVYIGDTDETNDSFTAMGRYVRITIVNSFDSSGGTLSEADVREFQIYSTPQLPDDQNNPNEQCPCPDQPPKGEPINTRTGYLWTSATDLTLTTPGPTLAWTRTYVSRAITATLSGLGAGWQHPYATRLITETMPGGEPGTLIVQSPRGNNFRYQVNGDGTFTSYPGIFSTLVQGSGVYTQTQRDQSHYVFAAATGRLERIIDPQGHQLLLEYDPADPLKLLIIKDAAHPTTRRFTLGYNAAGTHITSVSDGTRSVTYTYDAQGDLVAAQDVMGRPTSYTYQDHLLIRVANPLGQPIEQTSYEQPYTAASRAISQTIQDGQRLQFQYTDTTTILTTTAVDGRQTVEELTFAANNTLTSLTHNGTLVRQSAADANFAPGRRTDGNGNTTTTTYSDMGRPLTITDALGQRVQAAYDDRQRPTVITDTLGRRTELAYDDANNLIRQTSDITGTFPGFTTVFTYNVRYPGQHWLEETVGPDGVRMHYAYDALGQRTAVTRNYEDGVYADTAPDQDLRSTYGYDSLGRVVTTTVGVGTPLERKDVTDYNADDTVARTIRNYQDGVFDPATPDADIITTYGYDNLGRQVWVQDVLGRADVTHYDAAGRMDWTARNLTPFQVDADGLPLFQAFDPATPDQNVATFYGYDGLGRTTLVTETGILTGTFDPATRSFSQATERVTRTEYDELSRPVTVTLNYQPGVPAGPDVNVQTLTQYDGAGNVTWQRDALGRWTHMEYDALNRPITVTLNYENGD
ncbi:MAG: discoidin domain-containing protein, partial [Chloroflexaceae bacterium]